MIYGTSSTIKQKLRKIFNEQWKSPKMLEKIMADLFKEPIKGKNI